MFCGLNEVRWIKQIFTLQYLQLTMGLYGGNPIVSWGRSVLPACPPTPTKPLAFQGLFLMLLRRFVE